MNHQKNHQKNHQRDRAQSARSGSRARRRRSTHASHAWCSTGIRDGLCVTLGQHEGYKGRALCTDEDLIRGCYEPAVRSTLGFAIDVTPFRFWDEQVAEFIARRARTASAH